jgi:hypothetical protein
VCGHRPQTAVPIRAVLATIRKERYDGKIYVPHANPRTYRLTPRIMTSRLTPNSTAVTCVAVENTELAKDTQNVIIAVTIVIRHFFALDQFMGFSGSSGPFQPTIWVTGSTQPKASCRACDARFSAAVPSSMSSPSIDTEGAREGAAVLTAVCVGDSKKPDVSFGSEDIFGSNAGSSNSTILTT